MHALIATWRVAEYALCRNPFSLSPPFNRHVALRVSHRCVGLSRLLFPIFCAKTQLTATPQGTIARLIYAKAIKKRSSYSPSFILPHISPQRKQQQQNTTTSVLHTSPIHKTNTKPVLNPEDYERSKTSRQ